MSLEAWITLAVTALALLALIREWAAPDAVFLGATIVLALLGIIPVGEALRGFSNPGVLTVGALFVVTAALRETGTLDWVGHRVLGRVKGELGGLARLTGVVLPLSAFLNNTPVVAMLVPVVIDWCRKRAISPSRLLIPLSYLAILGGTCTLIGTSTNLVVHGLMIAHDPASGMTLFEIGRVGLPYALVGTAYLALVGRRLLPERKELIEQLGEARREYVVEMFVQPECRLVDQTVEGAGLRQLPGLFLIEIDRDGEVIAPVAPSTRIEAQDRLVFTGIVSTIVDLEKIPGLVPAVDSAYEVAPERRRGRLLCEAVMSPSSPLIGKRIREANFRALYNAAVVAVHRNGVRITSKIGDIALRPGDTLLLQTGPNFSRAHRNNPDFYLVSDVEGSRPLRHDRAWIAGVLFILLIAAMFSRRVDTAVAAFLAAGLMVATRCLSATDARQSVDWPLLITIAASFGVGAALERSGAASALAGLLVEPTQAWGPVATLAAVYLTTSVLTEFITNNAAAVLMFPIALSAAEAVGVETRPFLMAVALAASAAFSSPIGYQTHMLVYGPGGYRFTDFVRVGLPLNLLLWGVAVLLIPFFWPFSP